MNRHPVNGDLAVNSIPTFGELQISESNSVCPEYLCPAKFHSFLQIGLVTKAEFGDFLTISIACLRYKKLAFPVSFEGVFILVTGIFKSSISN